MMKFTYFKTMRKGDGEAGGMIPPFSITPYNQPLSNSLSHHHLKIGMPLYLLYNFMMLTDLSEP